MKKYLSRPGRQHAAPLNKRYKRLRIDSRIASRTVRTPNPRNLCGAVIRPCRQTGIPISPFIYVIHDAPLAHLRRIGIAIHCAVMPRARPGTRTVDVHTTRSCNGVDSDVCRRVVCLCASRSAIRPVASHVKVKGRISGASRHRLRHHQSIGRRVSPFIRIRHIRLHGRYRSQQDQQCH